MAAFWGCVVESTLFSAPLQLCSLFPKEQIKVTQRVSRTAFGVFNCRGAFNCRGQNHAQGSSPIQTSRAKIKVIPLIDNAINGKIGMLAGSVIAMNRKIKYECPCGVKEVIIASVSLTSVCLPLHVPLSCCGHPVRFCIYLNPLFAVLMNWGTTTRLLDK